MRAFVMHPDLNQPTGHAYTESLGWKRLARERGYDLTVFGARSADAGMLAELDAIGLFSGEPASFRGNSDPAFGELPIFLRRTDEVRNGCRAAWAGAAAKPDIVFLPWARAGTMNGAADWLEELEPAERPRMALNVVRPEANWTVDATRRRVGGELGWFAFSCRRLRTLLPPGALVFTAVEPRLATVVSQIGAVDCRPAPLHKFYPTQADLDALGPAEREGGVIRIGALGPDHTLEKGWGHLAEVAARVCAARADAAFFVQVKTQEQAEAMAEAAAGFGGARIQTHVGALPTADYFRRVMACDLILLPYDDRVYALMPSGIFADAVICGTPVVAPSDTWIADRLAEGHGAGVLFDPEAGPGVAERIATATLAAVDELAGLRARAAGQGAAWRRLHALEAHVDHVLARFHPPVS